MPSWIQIRVVSDEDSEPEPAGPQPDREDDAASAGLAKLFAVGAVLVLLGVVAIAGWYFGFRGGDQPALTAAGQAKPMPGSQFADQAAPVNPPSASTTSSGAAAPAPAVLTLPAESERRLSSDKHVAVVNGEPITEAMLEREVGVARVLYSFGQGQVLGDDPQTLDRMRADLLSSMVDEQLIKQAAQEAGVTVSDADLDARIDRLLSSFQITSAALQDQLTAVGLTLDDLRESLRTTMLTEQFVTQNPPPADVTAKSDYAAWVKVLQDKGDVQILDSGEAVKIVRIGQPAPAFTLRGPDGEARSLADFAGHPLLINFWATWCPPCRLEMPLFEQTYQQLKDDGFVVLAVDVQEGPEEVKAYVQEMGLSFPIVLDRSGAVANMYRVSGLPTSIFVDADGIVTDIQRGAVIESQLQAYLDNILPQ